jgi:hypothetical protein
VHPVKEAEHTGALHNPVFSLFNASWRRLLRPTRGRHPPLGPRRQRPTLALSFAATAAARRSPSVSPSPSARFTCCSLSASVRSAATPSCVAPPAAARAWRHSIGDVVLRGSASRDASARAASTASASEAALWRAMGRWPSRRNGRERRPSLVEERQLNLSAAASGGCWKPRLPVVWGPRDPSPFLRVRTGELLEKA